MTKEEALKLALEALSSVGWHGGGSCWEVDPDKIEEATIAIKEALAQPAQEPVINGWKLREVYFDEHGEPTMHKEPAQEPVAWIVEFENGEQELHFDKQSVGETITPLYTAPPQRPWVGLTEEEIKTTLSQLYCDINQMKVTPDDRPQKETVGFLFAKGIEAKLKEKNGL